MWVGSRWGGVGTMLGALMSMLPPWVWECCAGWATGRCRQTARNPGGSWVVPGAGSWSCVPHVDPYFTGDSSIMGACGGSGGRQKVGLGGHCQSLSQTFKRRQKYCRPPLSVGVTFRDLQWTPEIPNSSEPYIYYGFSYASTPMIKFTV